MVDYALYPICDTSILINLNLIKKFDDFLVYKKYIFVADKVKEEILNKFNDSKKFGYFLDPFNRDNLVLIDAKSFDKNIFKVIEHNLLSFKFRNILGTNKIVPNMGEFISALYAVELGIKSLYIDDKKFIVKYSNELIFKNIQMIQIRDALSEFLNKVECETCMKKLPKENEEMNSLLQKENEEKQLEMLLQKFGKKFDER